MKRKVIITKLPKGSAGLSVGLGANINQTPQPAKSGKMSQPDIRVNSTLQSVPRDKANLEAEKGEVAMLPSKSGIPSTFKIGGNRHHSGGTPLNLPKDSFIYSDTRALLIKDPVILKQFGMSGGSYTPAQIAKKYDVNNFKKILADNTTEKIQKDTAESMIANYNLKLAKLAIIQESMKGFPQGIPLVAMPYLESMQIDPSEFVAQQPEENNSPGPDNAQAQLGGIHDFTIEPSSGIGSTLNSGVMSRESGSNLGSKLRSLFENFKLRGKEEVEEAPYNYKENFELTPSLKKMQAMQRMRPMHAMINKPIPQESKYLHLPPTQQATQSSSGFGSSDSSSGSDSGRVPYAENLSPTNLPNALSMIGDSMAAYGGTLKLRKAVDGYVNPVQRKSWMTDQTGTMDIGETSYETGDFEIEQSRKRKTDDPYRAEKIVAGANMVTGLLNAKEARKTDKIIKQGTLADNQFLAESNNRIGKDGNYNWTGMSNGMQDPNSMNIIQEPGMNYNMEGNTFLARYGGRLIKAQAGLVNNSPSQNPDLSPTVQVIRDNPNTQTAPRTIKKSNIPEGSIVLKHKDYDTEEEYNIARNKTIQDNPGKPVYAQRADGKYAKIVVKGNKTLSSSEHIKLIEQAFTDGKVKKALYDKTLTALKTKGTLGKKAGFTEQDLIDLGEDGLLSQFTEMQKRNLETKELLNKAGISYEAFDNTTGKLKPDAKYKNSPYKSLDDVFAKTSVGVPKDEKSKGLQQLSYIGYNDLIEDKKNNKIEDPELAEKLKPFQVQQVGVSDEYLKDNPNKGTISKADTYYTNTTAGEIAGYDTDDITEEDVLDPEVENKPETKTTPFQPPLKAPQNTPFWKQDVIKTGMAARDLLALKKHYPWQATPNVVTPDVTFYDPTRELAANAEESNIAANTLAQFTGPQAFNARFNQIQGQAGKNAADILGKYNNLNVGISNQQAAQNAQIMNQAGVNRANNATSLWDKYQTVNQQFDVDKSRALNVLGQTYANAITNRAYTHNLNQVNPQFAVNPGNGGKLYFHNPRSLKGAFNEAPDAAKIYEQALAEHPTWRTSEAGQKMAWDYAKAKAGLPADDPYLNPNRTELESQVPRYPGSQQGQ